MKRKALMKKNKMKDEEQKRQPRRLRVSRETILVLQHPTLLGRAKGGGLTPCPTASSTLVSADGGC
jgi:hypothetical protein